MVAGSKFEAVAALLLLLSCHPGAATAALAATSPLLTLAKTITSLAKDSGGLISATLKAKQHKREENQYEPQL